MDTTGTDPSVDHPQACSIEHVVKHATFLCLKRRFAFEIGQKSVHMGFLCGDGNLQEILGKCAKKLATSNLRQLAVAAVQLTLCPRHGNLHTRSQVSL